MEAAAIPAPTRRLSPQALWVWVANWVAGCIVALVVGRMVAAGLPDGWDPLLWALPLAALVVGTAVVPPLRWRRWRWEVREREIDLERGVLRVRRTLIPMMRVQHVETTRGVLEQALGLATVVDPHGRRQPHHPDAPRPRRRRAAGQDRRPGADRGGRGRAARGGWSRPLAEQRLHPAAIAVYAIQALRQAAFPLLIVVAASVFGSGADSATRPRRAVRAGRRASAPPSWARCGGRPRPGPSTARRIRLRRGWLSVKEVEVPLSRVQALDLEQGPVQRLFGVQAVHVQTGGGGAGGEIVLDALAPAEIARLRELVAGRPARGAARDAPGRARAAAVAAGCCSSPRSRPARSA